VRTHEITVADPLIVIIVGLFRIDHRLHLESWQEYNSESDGAVGIWHETYRVDSDETVYDNVGPRGLGAAAGSELVAE